MDIHRCRFVPYKPSAINAVAFSHSNPRSAKHAAIARLAIGRANGDIEIWNPSNGTWHQETVIRGGKDRSIDGLVWINEPDQDLGDGRVVIGKSRLFSIGYTSTVTEWDLAKGKPRRHASGQHGDIWCIGAQPAGPAEGSNKLIAGTMDGELIMYSVEDDDLRFQRVLVRSPTKKAQIVSITFQSRKVVIVGCSDSTIRAYDITKGHMIRRMTLGSDLMSGSKDIIVWCVRCLPNGNIVSGDSTGQVCIWDGKTYTQNQRIQSHKQDVLSLATSADGTTIMSGGMDRRTCLYRENPAVGQRWANVWGRRYHEHDVKAMACFENGRVSVVVSGGPDANLMVVPLKEMGREHHRMINSLPQQPPMMSASKARFVVSWWDREVHIWALRKPATELFESGAEGADINDNRKLLKTVVIKGDSNIASAAVNEDGTLLVLSTATDVKAFRLQHQDPVKPSDVAIRSIELPEKLTRLGATRVELSPDAKWLCLVREGSRVLVARIDIGGDEDTLVMEAKLQRLPRLRRNIPRYILNGGLGGYDRSITQVAFSTDSKMLAVADLAGFIDTWTVRGHEEALRGKELEAADDAASSDDESSDADDAEAVDAGEQWVRNPNAKLLPKLAASPVVLSFSDDVPGSHGADKDEWRDAANDYVLAVITSAWNVLAFHPRQGSLTAWSRRNPRKCLPAPVQDLLDLPKGVLWQGARLWVYGVSFFLMLDMAQDLPKHVPDAESPAELQMVHGTKRKRTGPTTGAGGKMKRESLAPHKIQRHGEGEEFEELDVGERPVADESDSDDEMVDANGELSQLRNGGNKGDAESELTVGERKKWWITYKYRPILGVVPLSSGDQPLEVALVERPTWDVEMPERYFAGNEWER
ncbi:hypothetical protein RJ55_05043 [Drechmeria coniospora]|nr:hypothetical protein RJ55_05043 [Drechmeria coniospora]